MTNAGPPPREVPHPTADDVPQWGYRVDRDVDDPRHQTMLCWGTREIHEGDTWQTIAELVGGQQRGAFPSYNGILHVAVWRLRPTDHYRKPVPPGAVWSHFDPDTPDIPEPEPCQHGQLDWCSLCDDPL